MEDFESDSQVQAAPVESLDTEQAGPDGDLSFLDSLNEPEQINDKAYQDASVPDSVDGYVLAEKDVSNPKVEGSLLKSFRQFALDEQITRGRAAKLVSFTLRDFDSYEQAQVEFAKFCKSEGINRPLAEKLVGFMNQEQERRGKLIEDIQRNSAKAGGVPNPNAAKIATIVKSDAFLQKLHPKHKAAMAEYLELCQQR